MVFPTQSTTFALSTQYFYFILIIHPFKNYQPMKKLFLFLCLVLCSVLQGQAKEMPLFNSDGEAVAYIDDSDSDLPIYMWDGTPVAYLAPSDDDYYHVYGFNGQHLGWYERGVVRDHDGYIVGFQQGAISKSTRYEPYKRYKKYKPYKSYPKYPPSKAYNKSSFSYTSLALFLLKGKR